MLIDVFKKNKAKLLNHKISILALFMLLIVYVIIFFPIFNGVGQYWDGSFPYFDSQLKNYFDLRSESWVSANNFGEPLGYSSDYYLRFLLSRLPFLPEHVLFIFFLVTFTSGSFGIYLLLKNKNKILGFMCALAGFLNPAIFYKYFAGHLNYIFSYAVFIFFVYFLSNHFKKTFYSYVLLGLILALVGAQIQFFIFAGLVLSVYFIFNFRQFKFNYFLAALILIVMINLVWLSNFIIGAMDFSEIGQAAGKVSFKDAMQINYLNIFNFSFSKASLIFRSYVNWELIFFMIISLSFLLMLALNKNKERMNLFFLSCLILLMFLSTGLFHALPIWPFDTLYPMFREVGHFAPLIILFLIICLNQLTFNNFFKYLMFISLTIFLFINLHKFIDYSHALNYDEIRSKFKEFNDFAENNKIHGKIMTYPFYGEYGFKGMETRTADDSFRLSNTGFDSYALFTGLNYINNVMPPYKVKDSLQYQLYKNKNLNELNKHDIGYIFDFSGIYESYYEKYVPAEIYGNDLSVIKNDQDFFKNLLKNNPGFISQLSDNIYKLEKPSPEIFALPEIFLTDDSDDVEAKNQLVNHYFGEKFYYANKNENGLPFSTLLSLFNGEGNQAGTQKINLNGNEPMKIFYEKKKEKLYIKNTGGYIEVSALPTKSLLIDGELLENETDIISKIKIDEKKATLFSINDKIYFLDEKPVELNSLKDDAFISTYQLTDQNNLIGNGSFEQGLWNDQVIDCNNYDASPDILMQADKNNKTEGNQSLKFITKRHIACSYTDFPVEANKEYLFSFEYSGSEGSSAGYFMAFNGNDNQAIKDKIKIGEKGWQEYFKIVKIPDNVKFARLYFYGFESDKVNENIYNYDNVKFLSVERTGDFSFDNEQQFGEIKLKNESVNKVEVIPDNFVNIIENSSFEKGLWTNKVYDCNNYDENPKINMSLDLSNSALGKQSLKLEAARHTACTFTKVRVEPSREYLLSFKYLLLDAPQAGVYLGFNDPKKTNFLEKISKGGASKDWQYFEKVVTAPKGASEAELYFYVFSTDNQKNNIVLYDDVRLKVLPNLKNHYYLTSRSEKTFTIPGLDFVDADLFHKTIRINSLRTSFFLAFDQSYNKQWKLYPRQQTKNRMSEILPWADLATIGEENHFMLNNKINGWFIDPEKICRGNNCHVNDDGSVNLDLVIEFWPQRWFVMFRILSLSSLFTVISYLSIKNLNEKFNHNDQI